MYYNMDKYYNEYYYNYKYCYRYNTQHAAGSYREKCDMEQSSKLCDNNFFQMEFIVMYQIFIIVHPINLFCQLFFKG